MRLRRAPIILTTQPAEITEETCLCSEKGRSLRRQKRRHKEELQHVDMHRKEKLKCAHNLLPEHLLRGQHAPLVHDEWKGEDRCRNGGDALRGQTTGGKLSVGGAVPTGSCHSEMTCDGRNGKCAHVALLRSVVLHVPKHESTAPLFVNTEIQLRAKNNQAVSGAQWPRAIDRRVGHSVPAQSLFATCTHRLSDGDRLPALKAVAKLRVGLERHPKLQQQLQHLRCKEHHTSRARRPCTT